MKTLLKPGDMIRIRSDIEIGHRYKMINQSQSDTYLKEMLPPNTMLTIHSVTDNGKYRLIDDNEWDHMSFFTYTDTMFDPEILNLIAYERLI